MKFLLSYVYNWKYLFFIYLPTAANICNLCTLFHDILLQKLHIVLHSSLIRLLKNAFDLNFQCQHLNSLREFFWLVTVAQISYYSTYFPQLNPNITSCFILSEFVLCALLSYFWDAYHVSSTDSLSDISKWKIICDAKSVTKAQAYVNANDTFCKKS